MNIFEKWTARFRRPVRAQFTLEPTESTESGPCDCCGDYTRRVWGFVDNRGRTEAVYYVEWTVGKVAEHGAHVDLVIGDWTDGSQSSDRVAVSLEFRRTDTGPWFAVIDAAPREVARSELVGRALARTEVMGTPLAQRVFDMIDVIWAGDERILEVTETGHGAAN
jgi:hypothetical protein